MKKTRKSALTLNRETLRHLDSGHLLALHGGDTPNGTQAGTCRGAVSMASVCSGIQTVCNSDTLTTSEKGPTCM